MNKPKATTIFFLFLLSVVLCQAKDARVYVDERQELSAIVWKIAGCEEYNGTMIPEYKTDIEHSFGKYKDHPVMALIRDMRAIPDSSNAVGYNSVPTAAGLLCIRDGGIHLNEKVDIQDYLDKTDPRWTVDNIRKYAALLDDFYRKSSFHEFFTAHRNLYDECISSMEKGIRKYVKPEWFEDFYGKPFPELSVCISPAYGWNNFGCSFCDPFISPDAIDILIGITSYPSVQSIAGASGTIIHEISHSFTNPVFKDYRKEFYTAGEKILPHVPKMLTAAGYGTPEVIAGEYLNELMSMIYRKEVLNENLDIAIRNCDRHGFIWAAQGVRLMESFSKNREIYPTIDDFMPQLAAFMTRVSDQIAEIKAARNRRPFVESIFPEPGTTVSADLKEVVFRFSESMVTGITAIDKIDGTELIQGITSRELRKAGINPRKAIQWKDDRTLVYRIGVPLQKGHIYGLRLKAEYAFSEYNNMPLEKDIRITFKVN